MSETQPQSFIFTVDKEAAHDKHGKLDINYAPSPFDEHPVPHIILTDRLVKIDKHLPNGTTAKVEYIDPDYLKDADSSYIGVGLIHPETHELLYHFDVGKTYRFTPQYPLHQIFFDENIKQFRCLRVSQFEGEFTMTHIKPTTDTPEAFIYKLTDAIVHYELDGIEFVGTGVTYEIKSVLTTTTFEELTKKN